MKKQIQNYFRRLGSLFYKLWMPQEVLAFRNIRSGYLLYFFAFPLSMIFINTQNHFFVDDILINGFPSTTILFTAFAISSTAALVFATPGNIIALSKIFAVLTAIGFISWLFLPEGYLSFYCGMVFVAGVGGCVSVSSFSFVFVLNNAERFYGSAFMLLGIGLIELGAQLILPYPIVRKLLALLLTTGICVCTYLSKKRYYPGATSNKSGKYVPGIPLALFILLSYFTIRIMNFYVPAFQQHSATEVWGVLTLIPVLLCILLQAVFQYSIWTMCNVFFFSSIMSYVMWYAQLPNAAYLFAGMDKVGLFVSFYLIGSITNKFCNFRTHKLLVILCMPLIAVLYVLSDLLTLTAYTDIIAMTVSALLFVIFLLLSPAFSRYLFISDWSEEFRKLHMIRSASTEEKSGEASKGKQQSLDGTNLTHREKQVVLLLLQGMTLRQVAPELGLTFSTISTYSKTIYKKLGINSRAELFLLFSHQLTNKSSATATKK